MVRRKKGETGFGGNRQPERDRITGSCATAQSENTRTRNQGIAS